MEASFAQGRQVSWLTDLRLSLLLTAFAAMDIRGSSLLTVTASLRLFLIPSHFRIRKFTCFVSTKFMIAYSCLLCKRTFKSGSDTESVPG